MPAKNKGKKAKGSFIDEGNMGLFIKPYFLKPEYIYENIPIDIQENVLDKEGRIDIKKAMEYRNKVTAETGKRKPWYLYELTGTRWIRIKNIAAKELIFNGYIDIDKIGHLHRSDQANPAASLTRCLKMPILALSVMEEVERILKQGGLDLSLGVKAIKEAIDMAREKGDARTMLSAGKEILTVHNAYNKNMSSTQRASQDAHKIEGDSDLKKLLLAMSDDNQVSDAHQIEESTKEEHQDHHTNNDTDPTTHSDSEYDNP